MALIIQTVEAEIIQTQRELQDLKDQVLILQKMRRTKPECIGKGNPAKQCRRRINNDISHFTHPIRALEKKLNELIEKQQVILSQKKEITIPIVSAITDEEIPLTPVITTFEPVVTAIVSPTVPISTAIPEIKSKIALPIILSIAGAVYLITRKKK